MVSRAVDLPLRQPVRGPTGVTIEWTMATPRAAASRMADTRVRRVPAVARCGRGVLVTTERCERPVHVRTRAVDARRSGGRLLEQLGADCGTERRIIGRWVRKRKIASPMGGRIHGLATTSPRVRGVRSHRDATPCS